MVHEIVGLPVDKKRAVIQRLIDDNYDMAEADALRERFRKERSV